MVTKDRLLYMVKARDFFMELKEINSNDHAGFKNSAQKHLRESRLLTAIQTTVTCSAGETVSPMPAITSCKDCSELSFGCRSFFKTNTLCLWVQHIHPLCLLAFCASVQSWLLHEVQDLSCLQYGREVRVNREQAKMCHFPSDNSILSIWFTNTDVVRAG